MTAPSRIARASASRRAPPRRLTVAGNDATLRSPNDRKGSTDAQERATRTPRAGGLAGSLGSGGVAVLRRGPDAGRDRPVMDVSRAKVIRLLPRLATAASCASASTPRAASRSRSSASWSTRSALTDAIVAPAPADEAAIAAVVGHAAGTYLADQVRDGMSLGVGWGATLSMSLKALGGAAVRAVLRDLAAGRHDPLARRQSVGRRAAHRRRVRRRLLSADGTGVRRRRIDPRGALGRARPARAARARAPRRSGAGQRRRRQRRRDARFARDCCRARSSRACKPAGAVGDVLCHFSMPTARSSITRSAGAWSRSASTICGACPRSSSRPAGGARSQRYARH